MGYQVLFSMHSKQKGSITEAVVLSSLKRLGKHIALPFGDYGEYDLLVDEGDHFVKVQCKTGRLRDGCVYFNTHTRTAQGDRHYTSVDVFGVFCPEIGKTYLVPANYCAKNTACLRVEPSKTKHSWIKLASDFEI